MLRGDRQRAEIRSGDFVMTTFDKRKDAFESKFAHDEELRFKAEARRNKLLGTWAAGLLGIAGTEVNDYVRAIIDADFESAGDEDVFKKLRQDFDAAGVDQSDHQIRRTMEEMLGRAVEEVSKEG